VALAAPRRPVGSAALLAVDRACRDTLRNDIERALDAMAELDALNSLAQATAALGWTLPELVDAESFLLDATGAFHPFVPHPVPNPVSLFPDRPLMVLTGPNMAGKTTYLRCVGLLVFLAQVGMGVPAARARLTPVEALITSLNPTDNLRAGLSYFLSEVLRVKTAAAVLAEERRALVLFDEVFKGTNVKDAFEASAEVIRGFARAGRSGCIFASHLSELSAVLDQEAGIRFCRFDAQVIDGVPRYRHEIEDGVSDQRLGWHLLRQEGVPDLLARIRQPRGPG
jgi:DNA mismatch repair ATPase MutS